MVFSNIVVGATGVITFTYTANTAATSTFDPQDEGNFNGLQLVPVELLNTYVNPQAGTASFPDFTAQVRVPGGSYSNLFTYAAHMYNPGPQMGELDNGNDGTLTGFVMFDCLGTVDMQITYNGGPLTCAEVWPQSYGIMPTVKGNVITFPINGIKNIVLEINGNQYEALHVFANPIDTNIPSPGETNVMFFGAGLHEYGNDTNIQRFTVKAWHSSNRVTEDVITVPGGKTVYIQGGAVVKAQIRTNPFWNGNGRSSPKNNVTIRGRGVIDCSQWCGNFTEGAKIDEPEMPGMVLFCASNVTAEGVVIVNPPRFGLGVGLGAQNVIVNNVKELAREYA